MYTCKFLFSYNNNGKTKHPVLFWVSQLGKVKVKVSLFFGCTIYGSSKLLGIQKVTKTSFSFPEVFPTIGPELARN